MSLTVYLSCLIYPEKEARKHSNYRSLSDGTLMSRYRMRSKCTKHDITIEVSPHEIHVAMLYIVRRSKCQGHERNISYILQMDGLIKLKSSGALVSVQVIALSPVSTKGRPPTLILAGSVIGGRGDYYRGRLDHLHVS